MASYELIMPKMGESITEATILKWTKKEGDTIKTDEAVLEIATDKVDSEVPSPVAGTLVKMLYNEGDVVAVGKPVAIIETGGGASTSAPASVEKTAPATTVSATKPVSSQPVAQTNSEPQGDRFYSPLVLNIARQEGISMTELERMQGTGANGRVTKKDILSYVENRQNQPAQPVQEVAVAPVVTAEVAAPKQETAVVAAKSYGGNVEIIEMDRMRKLIAENMVKSKHTSAHVTSFVEADLTNVVNWRNKMKKKFQDVYGENLTFTPIFIEAVAKALRDFPMINSSIDGTNVVVKKDLNIGMAAALPSGNLIVPVIKNADLLNIVGLAKKVNDLADRARKGKLKADEIEGGTFTLSNVGTFGNVMGTPIIMQPQVAILAVGAIKKKPVVIETPDGDVIGIRHMMFLSHSYDHRIVDGALGGSFVRRVADYLEKWDVNKEI
jgi:2-oxoglutarate dehydrogenase E2 component (dihydrolipoamide succinyltransferase)